MGEITFENSVFGVKVSYSVMQLAAENRSVVRVTGVQMRRMAGVMPPGVCWITGKVRLDGQAAADLVKTDTQSCSLVMGTEYSGGTPESWSGFSSRSAAVYHRNNGTASMQLQVDLTVWRGSDGSVIAPGVHSSVNITLPRIFRAAAAVAEVGELGQEMVIHLSRMVAGSLDTLRWYCGTRSGTIAEKTDLTEIRWVPGVELAEAAPEAETVNVFLSVESWDGDTPLGTNQITAVCRIPENIVPAGSMTFSDRLGYAPEFGGFVQSQSRLRVQTQAEGCLGSSIRRIQVSCGALTGTGEDVTFIPVSSGELPVVVTVTDSRGRQCRLEQTVTVLPYSKPEIAIREAYRCNASGEPQPDGSWVKLVFDARADGGRAAYRAMQALHGQTNETEAALDGYENQCQIHGGIVVLTAGKDDSYDCRLSVTDRFQTVYSLPVWIPVAFVLLDFNRTTRAVGIGIPARDGDNLSIGLDMNLRGHRICGICDPAAPQDAVTKAYLEARLTELGLM